MLARNVVITGRAWNTPLGDTIESVCDHWYAGQSFFQRSDTPLKATDVTPIIGLCKNIQTNLLHDRKVQKAVTRKDLIGVIAAIAAAKDAGLIKGTINPDRFGMFVGSGSTQVGDLEPYVDLVRKCVEQSGVFNAKTFGTELMGSVNPMVMLQTLMNNTLCYTSVALDIRGVNGNYMDFQISGLRAVNEAIHAIACGQADVVLAGGVTGKPEPYHAEKGVAMGYLVRSDDPKFDAQTAVRPFDAKRKGTILSEGAAFLLLEEEEHALARDATILGRLSPMSFFSEGGFGYTHAKYSVALQRGIERVFAQPGYTLNELSCIIANANGSTVGDATECQACEKTLGGRIRDIPVQAPKAVFGEMSEASPVAHIIMALETLKRKKVPVTHNYDYGDDVTAVLNVTKEEQEIDEGFALVTSRSFSGICTAVGVKLP